MNPATNNTIVTPIVTNNGIVNYRIASTYHHTAAMVGITAVAFLAAMAIVMLICKFVVKISKDEEMRIAHDYVRKAYVVIALIIAIIAVTCAIICNSMTQSLATSDIGRAYGVTIEKTDDYLKIPQNDETLTKHVTFKDAKGTEYKGVLSINSSTTRLQYDPNTAKRAPAPVPQPQLKDYPVKDAK